MCKGGARMNAQNFCGDLDDFIFQDEWLASDR